VGKTKESFAKKGITHASIYLGPGHCSPEAWQEARMLALINKVTVGHVLSVALMEYFKRVNGHAGKKGK
jgi:hypothetical protein